jgi:hypothetical protein
MTKAIDTLKLVKGSERVLGTFIGWSVFVTAALKGEKDVWKDFDIESEFLTFMSSLHGRHCEVHSSYRLVNGTIEKQHCAETYLDLNKQAYKDAGGWWRIGSPSIGRKQGYE